MAACAQPGRVFRFGPFEADLANRQLFKDGVPVSLTGQPFEVLALLLEHPGQLVTRDQLRTRLWPAGTVVEFEHSITVAVTKLREVLGDKSQDSRFIATVPRHGYRFIASVSIPAQAALESQSTPPAETLPPTRSPAAAQHGRRRKWVVTATLAVLAVGMAYVLVSKSRVLRHSVAVQSAVSGTHARAASSTTAVPFNAPPHSIAVLPLMNESGDANQQYFSDGLSEDLITALSQVPGLKVIGRHSSFQFRDSKDDSKTIGAKLGVAHLLEGSVRHAGDAVRVSAELINASDGSTQWSERYDRPYKDLFALQDEITRAVADALKARLLQAQNVSPQSDRPPSGNLEAYNALLQGNFYFARYNESDMRKAIEYYNAATQLDARYALAWSRLSHAYTYLSASFLADGPMKEAYAKARVAADTAHALAPDLAYAHIAQAYLLDLADFDWRGAEAEFRRAVELAPADGPSKLALGEGLASLGQLDRAIDLTRQALATDPLLAGGWANLAAYLWGLNRFDEAERAVRKSIELQPGAGGSHTLLAMIETRRGDAAAALAAAKQELPPGRGGAIAIARQIGDDRAAADASLKALIDANPSAYQVAEIYAIRGDADKTFEWLDRALTNRDTNIPMLLVDSFISRYKDDSRFAAFCRKVGLPVPGESTGTRRSSTPEESEPQHAIERELIPGSSGAGFSH